MTTTAPAGTDNLLPALAVGTHLLTGSYRAESGSGRWWWSDEVDVMLGHQPGAVEAGAQALESRLHPDERGRLVHDAARALAAGGPVTTARRIVDAHGRTRTLLVTAQARRNRDGGPPETAGYVVDITPVQREAVQRDVRRALDSALVSTAAIERAKGVLMAVHGVDEFAADAMLVEAAGAAGATLRETATQMMSRLAAGEGFGLPAQEGVRGVLAQTRPAKRPHVHEAQLARRRAA
ncbi:PAS and ANTAR domain-containing protein [Isoptericola sp. NEAU-Y5]|uniref:PAS and ANTAR domain-containing protein n=1 Tax=Isoptericola luteus TaxID=2879484 RepID=A0ABS7ZG57_9MICO|nr:PAS and ANTAR domain-containing protein [Isoptericola sp. NEAU-Y5]MCA5893993.1 PAS and ANTAR domain-containing protein [Isoptericola sp. NEAU-Y5]